MSLYATTSVLTGRVLAAVVPDPTTGNAAPGATQIGQIAHDIFWWGAVACLVGFMIGAATWGVGHLSGAPHRSAAGKAACGWAFAGAVVLGAAAALINYGLGLGHGITP